jgi:hypothetical protein
MALLASAVLLGPSPATAWGPEGHAIVADIAEAHLAPPARRAVLRLLALEGHDRLDQVSSWSDAYSALNRSTAPWHYVDIPLAAARYDARRDCPDGDCAIVRLAGFVRTLGDRGAPPSDRLAALKWVVHLVGDIHQPLHAADHDDKGGNLVRLVYRGVPTNLHAVWDLGIIEQALGTRLGPDYSFDHAAARLAALRLDAGQAAADRFREASAEPADPLDLAVAWAGESHAFARQFVYPARPADPAGQPAFQAAAWPIVESRLDRAGVRLAVLLNRTLS